MELTSHSNQDESGTVLGLVDFFDLLARFDFEDACKHRDVQEAQEAEESFSLAGEKLSLGSCKQEQP